MTRPSEAEREWIGFDLDGTLAEYHGWRGYNNIGKAIKPMVNLLKKMLEDGIRVKIFTARANEGCAIPHIRRWLQENGLPFIEITATKDFFMAGLYDDRCIQVETNTGKLCPRCGRKAARD